MQGISLFFIVLSGILFVFSLFGFVVFVMVTAVPAILCFGVVLWMVIGIISLFNWVKGKCS